MKLLKVTKRRLTPAALRHLEQLQLSHRGLHMILCFGRKCTRSNITMQTFDPAVAPPDKRLKRLAGITLVMVKNQIVEVCADLNEAQQRSTQYDDR
ncbi:MAG: hypothetical protein HY231_25740 [Acidobacteria bacterium]|nr:hypothetical protein [Acidobacteriota bacterium]